MALIYQKINSLTEQQLNGFSGYIVVICEETILIIIKIDSCTFGFLDSLRRGTLKKLNVIFFPHKLLLYFSIIFRHFIIHNHIILMIGLVFAQYFTHLSRNQYSK